MEVRGTPGSEAWIKAKVKVIQIGEKSTSYRVQPVGVIDFQNYLLEVDAADILFETDAAEMLKAEKQPEEEESKGYSIMDPELPAVKYETPEAPRRRGRPKKATVEGLMAKAEQARIRSEAEEAPLWVENDT